MGSASKYCVLFWASALARRISPHLTTLLKSRLGKLIRPQISQVDSLEASQGFWAFLLGAVFACLFPCPSFCSETPAFRLEQLRKTQSQLIEPLTAVQLSLWSQLILWCFFDKVIAKHQPFLSCFWTGDAQHGLSIKHVGVFAAFEFSPSVCTPCVSLSTLSHVTLLSKVVTPWTTAPLQ